MAKHRDPSSPTRGEWLVLQMLQPKGSGPCRQQASKQLLGGGEGQEGPQASDQVSQSRQAGAGWRPSTGISWPRGCWFLEGPFLSGKVAIPLPRGTHSDHNANYGWNGRARQEYSGGGEKKYNLYIYIKKSLNCSEFLPVS